MNSDNLVQIATIQMNCSSDTQVNMASYIEKIRLAHSKGAQVVCTQELFESLYFCDVEAESNFDLAVNLEARIGVYSTLAKELGIVLIASLFEKRTQGLYYNTCIVLNADGNYLGNYRKQHIPDDPGFYEKYYFTPSDEGCQVFDTKYGKIGVLICWDQWFPEAARIATLKGAEILFYPTAIGWELGSNDSLKEEEYNAWKIMHQSHAIANGVHVVAVNRVGIESETEFWGGSIVIAPFGQTLYQAGLESGVHVQKIDLSLTEKYRRRWPFLRDRRVDTYAGLTKKWLGDD